MTECTDPKIRGVIGSFPSISMSGGILTAYILGTFFSWYNLAWTCCGVAGKDTMGSTENVYDFNDLLQYSSVSLTLVMMTMPRSPVWLRSKNLNIEAEKSSKWLGLESHRKVNESPDVIEKGRSV